MPTFTQTFFDVVELPPATTTLGPLPRRITFTAIVHVRLADSDIIVLSSLRHLAQLHAIESGTGISPVRLSFITCDFLDDVSGVNLWTDDAYYLLPPALNQENHVDLKLKEPVTTPADYTSINDGGELVCAFTRFINKNDWHRWQQLYAGVQRVRANVTVRTPAVALFGWGPASSSCSLGPKNIPE